MTVQSFRNSSDKYNIIKPETYVNIFYVPGLVLEHINPLYKNGILLIRHSVKIHDNQFAPDFPPVADRHSPFFDYFVCGEIQRLHKSLRARKHAPLLVGIQALYGIGRVKSCSDIRREFKNRRNYIPVVMPNIINLRKN